VSRKAPKSFGPADERLAARLQHRRWELELTLDQVAELAKCNRLDVWEIENAYRGIQSRERFSALARARDDDAGADSRP
jgi:hypothetical protein